MEVVKDGLGHRGLLSRLRPSQALGALLAALLLVRARTPPRPIKINVDALPLGLEPAKISDAMGAWVVYLLGERLVDSRRSGGLAGDLATSWTISRRQDLRVLPAGRRQVLGRLAGPGRRRRALPQDVQRNVAKATRRFYIDAVADIRQGPASCASRSRTG